MGSDNLDIPKELFSPSDEFVTAAGTIGLHWWFWNLEERKFSMSPGLLRLLGYTPEEYDPSRPYFYENIHPDDVRDNRNRIRKLLNGEASLYEIEYRVKAEKGAWQWYYNRGTVIKRDHEGKPVIVGGITMDISGPFKHLLSKVEEKDKFEFIFRNTHEAMLIIEINNDGKGRVIDSNQAATELFGRKRDEILGNIPQEYLKNDRTGTQSDYIQELLEKGYARYEMQVDLRDNELRWLEFTTKAISLTGENLFLTMVEDKTIDKRTKAALRESERLYRTLFEAAEDRIVLFDEEGEILLYSTSFYSSLGYTKEEFDALDSNETIHPDDRERLKLEGRKIFTVGHSSHEYRVMHKQGHYLHMASKNVLIPVEPNEKILVLSISRDMTERKKAMRDLELARDHAEESDRLKSAFLANMSHEIRTPMNSIVGFSNLLVNQNLEEETRSVYVARIIRNSELLLTLISDIIDLAKIESGQLSIIYGKQKISDLVAEIELYALDELKRLGKDNIRIHAVNNDRDCMLETDLMRVSQVLKNLVNNAIKFTE
ncbi:MAG: PAS domain S-box protein, partial [Bacteroidales bacterium]|nr:PAS domain S-box protein [Bacteroidales bacterium]